MEFYAKRHRHSKQLRVVSIPNGMEFYFESSSVAHNAIEVSIPNGMEFYLFLLAFVFLLDLFQFPTGWDSTIVEVF